MICPYIDEQKDYNQTSRGYWYCRAGFFKSFTKEDFSSEAINIMMNSFSVGIQKGDEPYIDHLIFNYKDTKCIFDRLRINSKKYFERKK